MSTRLDLFAYGFRPFFLLAGIAAFAVMAMWLCIYFEPGLWPAAAIPAWMWHAHEMLFGFVIAAVAGFLLTAVPNWTGARALSGAPLIGLVIIWLAGRAAMLPGVPPPVAAAVDLAFLPALGAFLAMPLIAARKARNLGFLVLIALLFAANLAFHLGRLDRFPGGEFAGLGAAADVIAILIGIIGGRIIPAFTQNALRAGGFSIAPLPALDIAALASLVLVLAGDLARLDDRITAGLALAAALANGLRLARWGCWQARRVPLLWVLHVGYGFLVLALALKGISQLDGAATAAKWLHALTIGCFATLILGVMTRASLGHTGRPLVPPRAAVAAYVLVPLAALVRVFAPALMPEHYALSIAIAGALWLAAFAAYLFAYAPILTGPRADGKPG